MTICLINFSTKKVPVKVPSIVTTVSHSSLHWTLSLLSASCDKVKFKHPDFVEKFATDWLSAQAGELETEDWREILIASEAVGPPGMVQPRSGQGPDWRPQNMISTHCYKPQHTETDTDSTYKTILSYKLYVR